MIRCQLIGHLEAMIRDHLRGHLEAMIRDHLRGHLLYIEDMIRGHLCLRCPDDVPVLRWHPNDDSGLLGGLMNGQIVIWDLQDWMKVSMVLKGTA